MCSNTFYHPLCHLYVGVTAKSAPPVTSACQASHPNNKMDQNGHMNRGPLRFFMLPFLTFPLGSNKRQGVSEWSATTAGWAGLSLSVLGDEFWEVVTNLGGNKTPRWMVSTSYFQQKLGKTLKGFWRQLYWVFPLNCRGAEPPLFWNLRISLSLPIAM